MSARQEGFNSHSAMGAYHSQYCTAISPLTRIADCLSSGNPVLLASSIQGENFINHITGDIFTYD